MNAEVQTPKSWGILEAQDLDALQTRGGRDGITRQLDQQLLVEEGRKNEIQEKQK